MSLSIEEQTLRELQLVNAQLNPGKALLKALGLLAVCAVLFTVIGVIVNSEAFPAPISHVKPVSRSGHAGPHLNHQRKTIKESYE
jgi:Na+/H+ antiporter NhaB